MKKICIFTALLTAMLLCSVDSANAQIDLRKGDMALNVGAGVVPGAGANVSFDYGLVDSWGPGLFTVGGYVGTRFRSKTYEVLVGKDKIYTETNIVFAPRATYRYAINNRFEVYGVVMVGVRVEDDYVDATIYATTSLMGGCRFFFTPNFGVFAEAGINLDVTAFNAGFCVAF